ncbi:MAG TPA: PocR ligand-binding domain-containing protein [Methanosarcina sp.]|nr:PocR ligand-binding domain-containing protein [Methanosarcina sp.]
MNEKAHLEFNKYGALLGGFIITQIILMRKKVETMLRRSGQCIRLKSKNIYSPEWETANLELADIIDTQTVQYLMSDFYKLVPISLGLNDLKGNVLVGVGWQDVCTKFHRVHPETCKYCVECNIKLSRASLPEEFKMYRCKNNMWDIAAPIIVGSRHVADIYAGQFFFEDESVDYDFFRSLARQQGFNEEEYIAALEKVPLLSREAVDKAIDFLLKFDKVFNQKYNKKIKELTELAIAVQIPKYSFKNQILISEFNEDN